MRWESPWVAAAAAAGAAAGVARAPPRARAAPAVLWVRSRRLAAAARRGAAARRSRLLPWVALVLAVLALARPQQGLRQSETETRGVDIVLAIDISPSMAAEDFRPRTGWSWRSRRRATSSASAPHDRIGLVGFAATAFTQCPLTLDHDALLELLDGLDFGLAEDGTAIGMGLATAVARLCARARRRARWWCCSPTARTTAARSIR